MPYKVDLVDWATTSGAFRKIMERDRVVVQKNIQTWHKVRIGDVAEVFDGPHATPTKTVDGPIFLGISSLNRGRLDLSNPEHLSEEDFVKWTKRVTPRAGDVVFSYETRLGEAAIIPAGLRCCLGRRMGLVRARAPALDPHFFLYQYLSPKFQDFLVSRTIHGSTVDRIALKDFPYFEIDLPPLHIQQAIAKVMLEIDTKIALNRRINQTLEAMAQAIFKSWFVDFDPVKAKIAALAEGRDPLRAAMSAISGKPEEELDALPTEGFEQLAATAALFPDEMVESELGEIPKGWVISNMRLLSSVISKGTTPSKIDVATAEDSPAIPFIKVKDISDFGEVLRGGLELISKSIHETTLKRSILKEDDLLFSIAGTIGRTAIIDNDLCESNINQAIAFIRLRDKSTHLALCWLTLRSRETQDFVASKVVQAVQANASLANIGDIPVRLPDDSVIDKFNKLTVPLIQEYRARQHEIRTMSNLRDTLLPKLLSGELCVSEMPMEHAK